MLCVGGAEPCGEPAPEGGPFAGCAAEGAIDACEAAVCSDGVPDVADIIDARDGTALRGGMEDGAADTPFACASALGAPGTLAAPGAVGAVGEVGDAPGLSQLSRVGRLRAKLMRDLPESPPLRSPRRNERRVEGTRGSRWALGSFIDITSAGVLGDEVPGVPIALGSPAAGRPSGDASMLWLRTLLASDASGGIMSTSARLRIMRGYGLSP